MPKITEPTVREHRAKIKEALIDSAEKILREQGTEALTAAAAAKGAGIARNSIYRYVDSVADLRTLVLERALPAWKARITHAIGDISDPLQWILAWADLSLREASRGEHAWYINIGRGAVNTPSPTGGCPMTGHSAVSSYSAAGIPGIVHEEPGCPESAKNSARASNFHARSSLGHASASEALAARRAVPTRGVRGGGPAHPPASTVEAGHSAAPEYKEPKGSADSSDFTVMAHTALADLLYKPWSSLAPDHVALGMEMTVSIVRGGFTRIEAGDDSVTVRNAARAAIYAVVKALSGS